MPAPRLAWEYDASHFVPVDAATPGLLPKWCFALSVSSMPFQILLGTFQEWLPNRTCHNPAFSSGKAGVDRTPGRPVPAAVFGLGRTWWTSGVVAFWYCLWPRSIVYPNCPKTRMVGFSRGFSMIVTQQAAKPLSTVDGSVAWELGEFRANDLVLEPLMIPFHMIMQNEFRDGPTQRRLSD
jgi:hypothetical protein